MTAPILSVCAPEISTLSKDGLERIAVIGVSLVDRQLAQENGPSMKQSVWQVWAYNQPVVVRGK
ncbi:hypothetical protein [Paraglaciecola sp. 25GB23A]|uniref:hypothetical protein n=1 Tax=Paraglaciecola sp. 25GB23A TaxID=3156068 RepID=UPI0032B01905